MPLDKRLLEELAKAKAFVDSDEEMRSEKRTKPALPSFDDEVVTSTTHTKRWRRPLLHPRKPARQELQLHSADVVEDCDDEDARPTATPRQYNIDQATPVGCIPIDQVHADFRPIFPYPYFNKAQSLCFETAYHSDDNMVVSAPTSTGKTAIMELAIVRLMLKGMRGGSLHNRVRGAAKVVYMAPIKALCQQISNDWRKKFEALNISCIELTGDSEDLNYVHLNSSDIILTTPEKWDSVTRKWKDNKKIMGQIALMLIDEVHLLNEDRGATLEAVVSRMNTVRTFESMEDCPSASLRFIALSATIPNMEDIGDWLNVPASGRKSFGQEFRPVKVDIKVLGFPKSKNDYLFDNNLNFKLLDLIKTYSSGKPSLVFCCTRKGTIAAASQIAKEAENGNRNHPVNPLIKDFDHKQRLLQASHSISDKALAECIKAGVGFHTAGMQHSERSLMESLFLSGDLTVLCATSSLAQGVNFPAHLVIIKSTQCYKTGIGYTEQNEMNIMQMIGRAGRPQFDTSAVAVILTQAEHKAKWENVLHGTQPIESNLLGHLTEHLNSEIVLKTITDTSVAIKWLKSTYLFKRIGRNPSHYGISRELIGEKLDTRLKGTILQSLQDLARCNLVAIDDDGFSVSPLEAGICMARFYIEFATMKQFTEIDPNATLESLIDVLSKAKELSAIILRQGEKKRLYEVSQNEAFRFSLNGKIKSSDMKVNCLIQAALANINIEEWSLRQDTQHIFSSATRIIRGMVHYLAERKCFVALRNAIILGKCLEQRMWENSTLVLKQLDKIGPVLAGNLVSNGITSFEKLAETDPRLIEAYVGRHLPFGNEVKQSVSALPRFDLQIDQTGKTDKGADIAIHVKCLNDPKVSVFNSWQLIVGDATNTLLYRKRFRTMDTRELHDTFTVPYPKSDNHELTVLLLNEEYIGLDVQRLMIPAYNPPPVQLPSDVLPVQQVPDLSLDPIDDSWLETAYTEYEYQTETLQEFDGAVPGGIITMTRPPSTPQKKPASPQKRIASPQKRVPSPQNRLPSTPNKPQLVVTQTQSNPPFTPQRTSVSECKHTCKDKSKCKHECCKGLKAKYSVKRKQDNDDVIDLTGRNDATMAPRTNNNAHPTITSTTTGTNNNNSNKRSKIVPLTHFFKPLVPQLGPQHQEQVVPNVDLPMMEKANLMLDPDCFDQPLLLECGSVQPPVNQATSNEPIYTFVSPHEIPKQTLLETPQRFRIATPHLPAKPAAQLQPKSSGVSSLAQVATKLPTSLQPKVSATSSIRQETIKPPAPLQQPKTSATSSFAQDTTKPPPRSFTQLFSDRMSNSNSNLPANVNNNRMTNINSNQNNNTPKNNPQRLPPNNKPNYSSLYSHANNNLASSANNSGTHFSDFINSRNNNTSYTNYDVITANNNSSNYSNPPQASTTSFLQRFDHGNPLNVTLYSPNTNNTTSATKTNPAPNSGPKNNHRPSYSAIYSQLKSNNPHTNQANNNNNMNHNIPSNTNLNSNTYKDFSTRTSQQHNSNVQHKKYLSKEYNQAVAIDDSFDDVAFLDEYFCNE